MKQKEMYNIRIETMKVRAKKAKEAREKALEN